MGRVLVIKKIDVAGRAFDFDEMLEIEVEPYKCPYCSEKITKEQLVQCYKKYLKGRILANFNANVDEILVYLNKYRKDYHLNTCLKKAHFITQVATETKFLSSLEEEFYYQSHKITDKFSEEEIYLTPQNINKYKFLKVIDENEYEENKNLQDYSEFSVNAAYIYGYAKKKYEFNLSDDKKIKILIDSHLPDEKVIASRMYYNNFGNQGKKSFDGYRYRGRGLMHLTWKDNYKAFGRAYKDLSFENKNASLIGEENITRDTDRENIEGNYDLLSLPIYAVQSGVWFWAKFRKVSGLRPPEYAEKDRIMDVSYSINGGINGIEIRKKILPLARKAFKVYDHYAKTYEEGDNEQKRMVKKNLELISFDHTEKMKNYSTKVNGDENALEILKQIFSTEKIRK